MDRYAPARAHYGRVTRNKPRPEWARVEYLARYALGAWLTILIIVAFLPQ